MSPDGSNQRGWSDHHSCIHEEGPVIAQQHFSSWWDHPTHQKRPSLERAISNPWLNCLGNMFSWGRWSTPYSSPFFSITQTKNQNKPLGICPPISFGASTVASTTSLRVAPHCYTLDQTQTSESNNFNLKFSWKFHHIEEFHDAMDLLILTLMLKNSMALFWGHGIFDFAKVWLSSPYLILSGHTRTHPSTQVSLTSEGSRYQPGGTRETLLELPNFTNLLYEHWVPCLTWNNPKDSRIGIS